MAKPELEFFNTELIPWTPIEGASGKYEKILSKDPETDSYTRLILVQPDLDSCIQQLKSSPDQLKEQEDWQEIFVLRGTLIDTTRNKTYKAGYYCCLPPGKKRSLASFHPTGALLIEGYWRGIKMAKPELEFFDTALTPWKKIERAHGQYEKILSKDPETGSYTRLIMSQPDMDASIRQYESPLGRVLCHEVWEEVFIVRGTIIDTTLSQTFAAGFYACRPPGMKHGPFFHPTGCVSYEFHTWM